MIEFSPTADQAAILFVQIQCVNIPLLDMIYVILAIGLSSVIHELRHALAANRHQLRIDSFGLSIYLCFPLTFVSLQPIEAVRSGWTKLEVASAGLMNNIVLCAVAIVLLLFNPVALLFRSTNGLVITDIDSVTEGRVSST